MKITNVDVLMLSGPGRQGQYGAPTGTLIRVDTDEGITGWGETDSHPAMVKAVVVSEHHDEFMSGLGALIIGQDPRDTEAIWRRMARGTFNVGRDGLTVAAMAAIDLALWDIRGKASGLPVCDILGGAKRRSFPFYGTYPLGETLEQTRSNARELKRLDLPAVKLGWRPFGAGDASDDEAIVRALREELGDDIELLIDGGLAFDVKTAIERSHMLADYGVYWFEEPLPIHDYEGHGTLAEASTVKIATGENGYHLAHFKTLLDHHGAAILNVDVTICPGYDVAMDVVDLAAERGVSIAPHGCQELQLPLAAAVPHGEFLEYYPVEVDPLRAEMFQPVLKPDADGLVTVPDRPGIGYELNMQLLDRYRVG